MKNLSKIFIATSLVVFASCEPDFDEPVEDFQATSGDADFSKYVALGNSLTSGYSDGALFISGQINSYPNMLATQMMMAGGGAFTQPLMLDETGGFLDLFQATAAQGDAQFYGRLQLTIGETGLSPAPQIPLKNLTETFLDGTYNNMGVPGAKSYHLIANGYGNPAGVPIGLANPYFARFASSNATSVLDDAAAQQPTFYSLWIGNNDVLLYATNGGAGEDQTGNLNAASYGANDISDPAIVAGSIETVLATMKAAGAKGVIANIPSITDIPYFTTVPYNPVSPQALGSDNITALNQQYALLNQLFLATGNANRQIVFSSTAASPVVIKDETLSDLKDVITNAILKNKDLQNLWPLAEVFGDLYGQIRPANADDLLVFTSQTVIGKKPAGTPAVPYIDHPQNGILAKMVAKYGLPAQVLAQFAVPGITYPLEDKWVLIPSEKEAVLTATAAYNTAIRQLATEYDLAFVDAHKAMQDLSSQSGITYFGNTYTTTYVSGGAFSLDAVHLTGKGYAVVANYFIDAINQKYGSTLRNVNPNNYPGVMIP